LAQQSAVGVELLGCVSLKPFTAPCLGTPWVLVMMFAWVAKSSGTVPFLVSDDDAVGYGIVLPQPAYLQTPRLGLLDLLELTGTLVLVVVDPRVGDYHGHFLCI
jgi:hypothetical protein